ncbi:MAG: retroviral-like aspartic protease family protein, partial [Chloroflexi bacterium]|nr:retroviral-like aspartic protease family protein [Chloroflexota bacterium]
AVVDTGSSDTWVPASILRRLGIRPVETGQFVTADGRIVEREMGEAVVRLDGRTRVRVVVFGDEGTEALIGAETLEGFHLGVDPVGRTLIPMPGRLGMAKLS